MGLLYLYLQAVKVSGRLTQLMGRCRHHVTNSIEFVHTMDSLRVGPEDLMAVFAVESLFTGVPIVEPLNLLT